MNTGKTMLGTLREEKTTDTTVITSEKAITPITFSRNDTESWIYCNYPEQIDPVGVEPPFGDIGYGTSAKPEERLGYYINQQTVSGTVEIFFSHDVVQGDFYYGIQVYNPNGSPVTVHKTNQGAIFNSWYAEDVWTEYFHGTSESYLLESGGNAWILEQYIPPYSVGDMHPFSGNICMSCSQPVIVSVFAYKDKSRLSGEEEPYPYRNHASYSGVGEGFFNYATIQLKASELAAADGRFFKTCHFEAPNTGEIVPIHLFGTQLTASADAAEPLNNLANWGVHNQITFELINDLASDMVFCGYLQTEAAGGTAVIRAITETQGGITSSVNGGSQKWKWLEQTVPANTKDTFAIQLVMGTYGNGPLHHMFTCRSV